MILKAMRYSDFEDPNGGKDLYIDPRITRWGGKWKIKTPYAGGATFSTLEDAEEALRLAGRQARYIQEYRDKVRLLRQYLKTVRGE